jgi:hypothetical protein
MEVYQGAIRPPGPTPNSRIKGCARVFSFSSSPQVADLTVVYAASHNHHKPEKRTAGNSDNLLHGERPRIHDGQGISDRLVQAGEILGCEEKGIAHVDWGSGVEWRVSIRVVVAGVGEGEGAGAIPLKDMTGFESILGNGGERPVGRVGVKRTTATFIVRANKYFHHVNDTIFVAEHVVCVVLFLGGDLDIS